MRAQMPVRDTADGKLIVRITDAEQMCDQAKRFMNKRLIGNFGYRIRIGLPEEKSAGV